jgi:hypothetical protein
VNRSDFDALLNDYNSAYKSQEWDVLEGVGHRLGQIIGGEFRGTVRDIREIARIYLGSLIGSGDYLTNNDPEAEMKFSDGLTLVEKYLSKEESETKTSLTALVRHGYEIQLFLNKKQSDSRNKAASALRKLARPDLAIFLATQQLEITRLNYYSLVVRASAHTDLSGYSAAIADGQKALKYTPSDKRYYPLITLSKAYVGRFKQTGDISDAELAFEMAEKSFELKPDEYSANSFLKIIYTMGLAGMEELISNLKGVEKNKGFEFDLLAIQIAKEVLLNSKPKPTINSLMLEHDALADELFDSWLDLELPDDFQGDVDDADEAADYFEDYFEEYFDSLNDPQNPHLEP